MQSVEEHHRSVSACFPHEPMEILFLESRTFQGIDFNHLQDKFKAKLENRQSGMQFAA